MYDDDEQTAPHTHYIRDSFERFYAPRHEDHLVDEPETWPGRIFRGCLWVAVVLAVVARCWP